MDVDDVTNVKRLRGTSPHFKQEKLLNTLHSSFFFLHICTHLALGGRGGGVVMEIRAKEKLS